MDLKLVVFDVDGTLVDSQGDIVASMKVAFDKVGLGFPPREAILGIVGLSLPEAMARLAPLASDVQKAHLVEAYKSAYALLRQKGGTSPLYPGLRDVLISLGQDDEVLLGIATGKSRRGLTALLAELDLPVRFVTTQVADDHPSKPHPSMLTTALAEAGVCADRAVMIGDTSYDMQMAQNAGMRAIAVGWGYHPREALSQAALLVESAEMLEEAIRQVLGGET